MLRRQFGFTLAEVLIALALLGVVAAFAIPKILQSVQDEKKLSLLSETVSSLNEIIYEQALTNQLNRQTFASAIQQKLNPVKYCDTNADTQGCWSNALQYGAGESNQPGFVLASGLNAIGFEDNTTIDIPEDVNGGLLDYNGTDGPNKLGQDQLWLSFCLDRRGCTFYSAQPQKYGTIVPFYNADYTALYTAQELADNTTLFRQVFQLQ